MGNDEVVEAKKCEWKRLDKPSLHCEGFWKTGCGVSHSGYTNDDMRFCCYCGEALVLIPWDGE